MAKIVIFEAEERYRKLLSFVLEGMRYSVADAGAWEEIPPMMDAQRPDLILLGIRLDAEADMAVWLDRQRALPAEAPVLILFSGNPEPRKAFLERWTGPKTLNVMAHPVNPYPLLAMVKNMLTATVEWRRGQHAV